MGLVPRPDRLGVTVNPRGMPQVKLNADAVQTQIIQNAACLIEIVQEIARHILDIQRLYHQTQIGRLRRGPCKIVQIGLFGLRSLGDPGHHMHPVHFQPRRQLGRPKKAVLKPPHIIGHGGKAAIPRHPVARRRVDQGHGQPGQRRLPVLDRVVIRKQHLHPVKPCLLGKAGSVQHRNLGEQHGDIRGETGHQAGQVNSAEGMIGKKQPADHRPNQRAPSRGSVAPNSTRR